MSIYVRSNNIVTKKGDDESRYVTINNMCGSCGKEILVLCELQPSPQNILQFPNYFFFKYFTDLMIIVNTELLIKFHNLALFLHLITIVYNKKIYIQKKSNKGFRFQNFQNVPIPISVFLVSVPTFKYLENSQK